MDQLPRLGKRELICLLSFTCNYVVFVWRGFLFLWVLGMGYVILLWHSLSLPYNYSAPGDIIGNFTTFEGRPLDALNVHGFARVPWILILNASSCCKMIPLNIDISH